MFIVTPDTLLNAAALVTKSVPKRMLGRIMILPRRGAGPGVWARLLFEGQLLRFTGALIPFIVAMFVWPQFALPIAQAPLAMILVIAFFETRVFHVPPARRAAQTTEAAAATTLDTLHYRATALLTRIAADNDIASGDLLMVVEQSELARVAPLTLVSVQRRDPPSVLALSADQRQAITDALFADGLSERDLQSANQRAHLFVRSVTLETHSLSAHARMAARMRSTPKVPDTAVAAQ